MFCPKCKYEYIEGVKTCSTCGAGLVNELPKEGQISYEYVELVTLFETGDLGLIGVAKSILDDAGIRYFAKGEDTLNILVMSVGFNPIFRKVQLQVSKNDEEVAKELLKDLFS